MFNFEILEDYPLDKYNTYGIKTKTKYLAKPENFTDLKMLIQYLKENNIKYYILGSGSNVILPDTLFMGYIISLERLNKVHIEGCVAKAEAGILLGSLIKEVLNHNLSGLEYLYGIPGTLGGALYGNAGAYMHTIYDYVKEVLVLRNNELVRLKKDDLKILYRYTSFKENNDIILEATFEFLPSNKEILEKVIADIREKRKKLPLEYKNAGSVFKNPEGDYAGRLIESVGLKGYKVGDAKVSEKHANFIVNTGNMTSKDLKTLINIIKKKVNDEYKIELELEQIIIDWD